MEKLPNAVRFAVLRILRPAESAVRRLIVIAAHGLQVKLPARTRLGRRGGRSWPRAPEPRGLRAFQLFDTRKRFEGLNGFAPKRRKAGPVPRITFIDPVSSFDPRIPMFREAAERAARAKAAAAALPRRDRRRHTGRALGRRLAAIDAALQDIPKQAVRMARWQARRALKPEAKFRDPLRIGKPPGHRKKPVHEVDGILGECHSLARDLPPPPPPTPPAAAAQHLLSPPEPSTTAHRRIISVLMNSGAARRDIETADQITPTVSSRTSKREARARSGTQYSRGQSGDARSRNILLASGILGPGSRIRSAPAWPG